jgi:hypothetical protein
MMVSQFCYQSQTAQASITGGVSNHATKLSEYWLLKHNLTVYGQQKIKFFGATLIIFLCSSAYPNMGHCKSYVVWLTYMLSLIRTAPRLSIPSWKGIHLKNDYHVVSSKCILLKLIYKLLMKVKQELSTVWKHTYFCDITISTDEYSLAQSCWICCSPLASLKCLLRTLLMVTVGNASWTSEYSLLAACASQKVFGTKIC